MRLVIQHHFARTAAGAHFSGLSWNHRRVAAQKAIL